LFLGLILADGFGCHLLGLSDTSFWCRISSSEEFTHDTPVSSDARSAGIGSAKMPVEPILGRIQSSEVLLKPDDVANAERRFFQMHDSSEAVLAFQAAPFHAMINSRPRVAGAFDLILHEHCFRSRP
jgi:hypothetical protein